MNELRWILIGFGIVLLAGIYLWGRRGSAAVAEDVAPRTRDEPSPEEDEPETDGADEERPVAYYEVTAVRPLSPRTEARVARVEAPSAEVARPSPLPDFRRGRVEPTLGGAAPTEELPVQSAGAVTTPPPASSAPTLSSSDTPSPRRPEKRKILSLRLSVAPQKIEGAKLLEVLQAEQLTHGKYDVFHRLHDGQSVFSIASMVEPGTFDLEKIGETLYPGVTLFAQLPGPVPGMHALNELVACARRLHQSLGGVLQDDRGVPLTVHRIERLRQEVREFERPAGAGPRTTGRSEGYQE